MARCLIIGCGCRGAALAAELQARGHAVRASSRDPDRVAELRRLGVDAVLGDPDRVATLARAFEHVTVAVILLGSATGSPQQLAALHSTRLDMLLSKLLDSTVRGVVYEAGGRAGEEVLAAGAARVRAFCEDSRVPYALLGAPGDGHPAWVAATADAVEGVLAPR